MIIAAVVNETEEILPIVEGNKIRLYNTGTKKYEEFDNPANHLTEGRRGATLKFAEEKGATAFVTPPQTFCELSYKKAVEDSIQFLPLEVGVTFHEFERRLEDKKIQLKKELKAEDVAPSHAPK